MGMAPGSNAKAGCELEHIAGLSNIHSVNTSIRVSGGIAIFESSVRYNPDTEVMKFTANLHER